MRSFALAHKVNATTQESEAALLGSKSSAKHVSRDPEFQYQVDQDPKCGTECESLGCCSPSSLAYRTREGE